MIVAEPGNDLGLLFYTREAFGDFVLRLQFRLDRADDNSGVCIRSRDPLLPVPDRNQPGVTHDYVNKAFVAVDTGFEVQIDDLAQGNPSGLDIHRTGAIYGVPPGSGPGTQVYTRGPALQPGQWYDYEIQVVGDKYTVRLNGQQTTAFTNNDGFRGHSNATDPKSGYIGLQTHWGRVAFRSVRIKPG